ncbi:MAG: T9SS type A sorting domain-containing protein [Sphingobacteriales bacterium]
MKLLKIHLLTTLLIFALPLLFCANTYAQNTYDWRPNTTSNWETPGNWQSTSSTGVVAYPAATYPGLTSTDIVRIGVNTSIATFTRQPTIKTGVTYTVASVIIGNNNTAVGSSASIDLSIGSGSTLNVSGTFLQMHSATGGAANSGGRDVTDDPNSFFTAINTSIYGPGTVHCGYFTVGDNTVPGNPYVNNLTYVYLLGSIILKVDNDFTLNSASYHLDDDQTVVSRNNDAEVSVQSATITINGQLKETNYNPFPYVVYQYAPLTAFSLDVYNNANSPTLNLANASPLSIGTNIFCNNTVDFFNLLSSGGAGRATVNYTGTTNQRVYTYNASLPPDSVIDHTSATDYTYNDIIYQDLGFSGSGTKTIDAATLSIDGNFSIAGNAIADIKTNNVAFTINGNYTAAAGTTLLQGSGDLSVSGNFTNNGTYTPSTGYVLFPGTGTQNLNGGTTNFNNVTCSGGSNKVIQSGTFNISSISLLTLSGTNTNVTTGGGNLTLMSDVNGTATIPALTNGCNVSGSNVTVQRYIPGGSSTSRGYRLLSSAVSAGSDTYGNKIYSINYLLNSTYISGTSFPNSANSKTGNPSLYLYRENLAPLYTTFLNSNYIGIANYGAAPTYGMNDTAYPTANIPVGNGYLFYFRGGPTTTSPFVSGSLAQPAVLVSTGTLNQGNITVANWYTPSTTTLGRTTASGDPAIEGFNLVGNPYPSSIDWNKADSVSTSAAIYAPHVTPFIYMLIPGGQAGAGNYGIYNRTGAGTSTNGATHIIPGGVGFFVIATSGGPATLKFTEAAKVTSQPSGSALFLAKLPSTAKTAQILDLQMKLDSINSDEMIISFDPDAKSAYNMMEDARYKTGSGKVNLASLSSDNISLAINQLPLALKGDTIKLKVGATASGNYTLSLKSITGIPQIYDIWLKDALTKDSVNLRTAPTYSFTINTTDTTTFGVNRFKLILVQNPAMAYQLLSFDAAKTGNNDKQVQLTWKTANEQNYTSFTVGRSNDNGKTFDVLGETISSAVGTYTLLDKNPLKGDNLYRLKQVDINNTVTYSNVVNIQYTENTNMVVNHISTYPNPATNIINLSFEPKSKEKTIYDIRVTNSSGMVVKFAQVTEPHWEQNVSNLLTGTYLIQVTNKNDNSIIGQTKFVKL